jgi:hypothetical protein
MKGLRATAALLLCYGTTFRRGVMSGVVSSSIVIVICSIVIHSHHHHYQDLSQQACIITYGIVDYGTVLCEFVATAFRLEDRIILNI